MKTRVTLLSVETREFKSDKKPGHVTRQFECQCIVHGEKIEVGVAKIRENVLPGYVAANGDVPAVHPDAPTPGDYLFEYGLGISWDKKELGGILKSITPMGVSAGKSVSEVLKGEPAKV